MTNADKDNRYTLLGNIDTPAQLRELPVGQLPQLCGEIRQFLIEALSSNPGHFASSMGRYTMFLTRLTTVLYGTLAIRHTAISSLRDVGIVLPRTASWVD